MNRPRNAFLAGVALVAAIGLAGASNAWATGTVLPPLTPLHLGQVHIAGGYIDVTTGGLIVPDYNLSGGSNSFGFVPTGGTAAEYGMVAINDAINSGLNISSGYWDGQNGINSSSAAGAQDFAVGYIDNALSGYGTWKGYSLSALPGAGGDQALVGYTYWGDADMNGVVDSQDYSLLTASLGQPVPAGAGWVNGDFDYSGFVDSQDYSLLTQNLGKPQIYTASAPVVPSAAAAAVPEPSTIVLLVCAALALPISRVYRRS